MFAERLGNVSVKVIVCSAWERNNGILGYLQEALKDLLGSTIKGMMEVETENHLGYGQSKCSDNEDFRNESADKLAEEEAEGSGKVNRQPQHYLADMLPSSQKKKGGLEMADLMEHITDETNGLTYTLHGDYYFPDISSPQKSKPIGKYGLMRKASLEAHRPGLFNRLLLSGKLYDYLAEVDEQANEQLDQMIPKMALAEGVTEELKATDPIRWVGLMNNLKACAEESILSDLIYD